MRRDRSWQWRRIEIAAAVFGIAIAFSSAAGEAEPRRFPVHPLASAPTALPQPGTSTGSLDPRSAVIAERLREGVAEIRARQAAARLAAAGDPEAALESLRANSAGSFEARFHRAAGTPRMLRARVLERAAESVQAGSDRDLATARRFLRRNRSLLALDDPDRELALVRRERDELGRTHLRFAQRHQGLEVWPAEMIVHLDPQGNVDLMNGSYVATPRQLRSALRLDAAAAIARARAHVAGSETATASEPEQIVYAPGDRAPRMAWRLALTVSPAWDWLVVVDAESGKILTSWNRALSVNVAGSGLDLLNQNRALNVWSEGGQFFLTDTSKPMFDAGSNPPQPNTTRGAIIIQDAANQPPNDNPDIPPNLGVVQAAAANGPWLRDGVSAAFNFSKVYDYFNQIHNRNSLDGNGAQILAVVRLGVGFDNAFFNPGANVMGFGDGKPYAAALDIVAHELAHGVTSTSSNLVYQNQSGALNEAMSDIFGEAVESFVSGLPPDWLNGTVFPEPSRSLEDPSSIIIFQGRPYPEKFSQLIQPNDPFLDNFQGRDNGGVHLNSSIINHGFYQLAEGLPGAIGLADAARIFFRANTVHLTQNAQFIDARLACIQAAEELFGAGSAQATKTAEAFTFIEVAAGDPTPDPPGIPGTSGPDATLFLFVDALGEFCSFLGGDFCLGRKATGDPPSGTWLGLSTAQPTKIGVTGDGTLGVFVNSFFDACLIDVEFDIESCVGLPSDGIFVNSVAMSPTANVFGFVLLDESFEPDNLLSIIDLANSQVTDFILEAPALDHGTIANVAYADAMEFTTDERFVIYDALNQLSLVGGQFYESWSIYAIDLVTGATLALVPPFEGLDFAFPSVSQRSDGFLTFDVYESGFSTIYAMDLTTGDLAPIGDTAGLGVPGYTGDDTGIVFSQDDSSTATGFSLIRQGIAPDGITPVGQPTLWLRDADFGVIYRSGTFDTTPLGECEDSRDNDGDDLVDFPADPGCENAADPLEIPEPGSVLLGLVALASLALTRRRKLPAPTGSSAQAQGSEGD